MEPRVMEMSRQVPPYLLLRKYELMAAWFGRDRPEEKTDEQEEIDVLRAENFLLKTAVVAVAVSGIYLIRQVYNNFYNRF